MCYLVRLPILVHRAPPVVKTVKIATCQPPAPKQGLDTDDILGRSLDLLAEAGREGAQVCCLPECVNVMSCDHDAMRTRAEQANEVVHRAGEVCAQFHMYGVLPIIERRGDRLYNTAVVVGRDGQVTGRYDKVHLTKDERENWGLTPGSTYPVFDLDFGRVGVMICYDGCFPEPARILALAGAEIIFFPSLQRSFTEDQLALQVRARAADNFVHVVRSSYGTEATDVWRPGTMVGKSCIVAPDGTIIVDLGKSVGVTYATVDLALPLRGARSHAGEEGVMKDMRFADRRPDTYGPLAEEQ